MSSSIVGGVKYALAYIRANISNRGGTLSACALFALMLADITMLASQIG